MNALTSIAEGAVSLVDSCPTGAPSRLQFTAVAGTQYRIAFDGASGAQGPYTLNLVASVPVVSPSPASLTFDPQAPGSMSASRAVTITNTGDAALTVASVAIAGTNPDDFFLTSDGCSGGTFAPTRRASCACASRPRS